MQTYRLQLFHYQFYWKLKDPLMLNFRRKSLSSLYIFLLFEFFNYYEL